MDYTYRKMPIRSLNRSYPSIRRPKQKIKTITKMIEKRLWLLIFRFLSIDEILSIMSVSKQFYSISYEFELWREILSNQFKPSYILSFIEGTFKKKHIATNVKYSVEKKLIRHHIPSNPDDESSDDEVELFQALEEESEKSEPEASPNDKLKNLSPNDYRKTALCLYQFCCIECKKIKIDCFLCNLLKRCICLQCLKDSHYRMLSASSAKKKYFISDDELFDLNLNYVETENPYNSYSPKMKLFYDFQIERELEKRQTKSYVRMKQIEEKLIELDYEDALDLIYGKFASNYIKGSDDDLERCVTSIIKRYERGKKLRNPLKKSKH